MTDDEARIKSLEFVTCAVISGKVHPYDAATLASEYFMFLKGFAFARDDDDDAPNPRRSH